MFSSDSATAVDNSEDDHSDIGDTECSTRCDVNEDGEVEFTRTCNGAQVSSGTFTDGTTCAEIIASQNQPEDEEAGEAAPSAGDGDAGFDLQGGAI